MNIVITGRSGRMGLAVAEAVEAHSDSTIHGTHDTGEELGPLLEGADAVIDFTIHSFTAQLLQEALATRSALVIGTTGHDEKELAAIHEAIAEATPDHEDITELGITDLKKIALKEGVNVGGDLDLVALRAPAALN